MVKAPSYTMSKRMPREGTMLRNFYDFLQANRGVEVDLTLPPRIKEDLRDYYGLDLRCVERGAKPRWCLQGQWLGKTYIDYTKGGKA